MATCHDHTAEAEREVMRDISYFEGYELPMSPPETPPMKQEARIALPQRTPSMQSHLDAAFARTPPGSPRKPLKRTFSNNNRAAYVNGLSLTPPSSPPTRFGIHSTLVRTMSDTIPSAHQISIFALKSRPKIVTINVTDSSSTRRRSLQRSSSYSSNSSTGSASRDPLDRVKDYSVRSTDSRYPTESPLAPPAYSPPPNTPANGDAVYTTTSGTQIHGLTKQGAGAQDNDPFNPFSAGPKQYPNHSLAAPTQLSNGVWQGNSNGNGSVAYNVRQPILPSPGAFETPNSSLVDLEKARRHSVSHHPKKKRGCCGKKMICCVIFAIGLLIGFVAAALIVERVRHHFQNKHSHPARAILCGHRPGLVVEGRRTREYQKCT